MASLQRFLSAQAPLYDQVLVELGRGRKVSHWMWFIFPQIQGLGRSATARYYAITSHDEAVAYLQHPILGPRLIECSQALQLLQGLSAEGILGPVDAVKLRSSLTLFSALAEQTEIFERMLDKYFADGPDKATLGLLDNTS